MISERFKAFTRGFCHFWEKFELERNTQFSVILNHTLNVNQFLNVILGFIPRIHTEHLSNVILGLVPRIHAEHSSLDTRVKPEYDRERSLIQCFDVVRECAGIFKRRVQKEYTSAKISSRHQLNEFSLGRSMIEMLGVLAIIGVLSVGGIQGFSKAMETYQSHKQLEQINSLIYHILELRDTFKQDYRNQSTTRINGLMGAINALGYLPDDMKLISNETAQDKFGNIFHIAYGVDNCRQPDDSIAPCSEVSFHLRINLKTINNAFSLSSENQCKNIIKAVTAFDAENGNINRFELRNQADINDSHYTTDGLIYGRQYCSNSRQNCFKNMTPIKITQFCKSCTTENSCDLVLYFIP